VAKKKSTPIKIRKKDIEDYKRIARNIKSKINRTQKNYGVDISSEINLPSLESFKTRSEFNAFKDYASKLKYNQSLQFVKNKQGVVARKSDVNKLVRKQNAIINERKKLKKRIDKLPVIMDKIKLTVGEKQLGLSEKEKRRRGYTRVPKKFNFNEMQSQEMYNKRKKQIEEKSDYKTEEKLRDMKANYMRTVNESLNHDGYEIVKAINEMPDIQFYEMYMQNESDFGFEVWYTEEEDQLYQLGQSLLDLIKQYKPSDMVKE